jgi:hypothetical protein
LRWLLQTLVLAFQILALLLDLFTLLFNLLALLVGCLGSRRILLRRFPRLLLGSRRWLGSRLLSLLQRYFLLFKLSFLCFQILPLGGELIWRQLAGFLRLRLPNWCGRALRLYCGGSNDRFRRRRRLGWQSLRYRRSRCLERLFHLLRFGRINVLPAAFDLRVLDRLSRSWRCSCRSL